MQKTNKMGVGWGDGRKWGKNPVNELYMVEFGTLKN